MKTVIVEARPSDATGQPVDIRLAGGGRGHYLFKDQSDWRAGVISLPRIQSSLGFGKDGFTGGAVAQASAIGFSPAQASTRALIAGLVWNDAPITVSVSDDEAADPSFQARLAGTVAGYSISAGRFVFTLSDMAGRLGEPLVKDSFAGTGGIEGDAAAKGRVKRRSWGRCWNVEGRVLLAAYNIYEFGDPARQLGAFDAVKDKGRPVTIVTVAWAGSIAATLDALKAAQAPEGGCAAAPSIACVKFWTQPSTLTADLRGELGTGYVEHVPGIAAAISAAAEGPSVDGLAALAALRPDPAGLHADDASETPAQMLDRLTLRASLSWGVTADKRIALRPIAFADPVETVRFQDVERRAAYAPVANVKVGFQKNHRVHTDAEISAAVLAGDVVYPNGQTVTDLQPAQPGADVTGQNKAADTAAVAGRPAGQVTGGIDANAAAIVTANADIAAARTSLSSDIAAARDETSKVRSDLSAAVSDVQGQAATARSEAAAVASNLSAEVDRAKGAEGTLTTKVQTAQGRADAAYSAVTDETVNRAAADSAITGRVATTEAQLRGDQDSVIAARVRDEAATRATADSAAASRTGAVESRVGRVEGFSGGDLVRKGTFADGLPGDWPTGAYDSRVFRPADVGQPAPPSGGYIYLMRGHRDAFEGDGWIEGAWGDRRLRVTGYASGEFSAANSAAGVMVRFADGTFTWVGVRAAKARTPGYSRFDEVLTIPTGATAIRPWLQNDGNPGDTANEVRLHSLSIRDATQAEAVGARITDEAATRAAQDSAIAGRVSSTEAQLRGDQDSVIAARITDEATTRASQDSALAGRATSLESSYGKLSDSVNGAIFPGFERKSDVWGVDTSWTGRNAGIYWENGVKGAGLGWQTPAGGNHWLYMDTPAGFIRAVKGRKYRAGFFIWQWNAPNGFGGNPRVYWEGFNQDRTVAEFLGFTKNAPESTRAYYAAIPDGGFHCYATDFYFDDDQTAYPNRVWLRPRINVDNMPGNSGYQISGWFFREITDDVQTNARITDEATTRANQDSAIAGRVSTTEAQLRGDQDSTIAARIRDEATTRASQDSAAAARASALEARSSGAGNLLSNSAFAGSSYAGWTPYGPMQGYSVNEAGDYWRPNGENVIGHHSTTDIGATGMGAGGGWYSDPVPVIAGRFYQFYAFLAAHRAIAVELMLEFLGVDNQVIQTFYSGGIQVNTGGRTAASWSQRGWMAVEAPSGAAAARFTISKWGTVQGESNSYLWIWRPYVGEARQGQSEWNPYGPASGRTTTDVAFARISDEATTRVNNDSALAGRTSSLESNYAAVRADLNNWNSDRYQDYLRVDARVSSEEATRSSAVAALASRTSSLEANYGGATGGNLAGRGTFKDSSVSGWPDWPGASFGGDTGMPANPGYPAFARFVIRDTLGQSIRRDWRGRRLRVRALLTAVETGHPIGAGFFVINTNGQVLDYVVNYVPAGQGWTWVDYEYTCPDTAIEIRPWLQIDGFDNFGAGIVSYYELTDVTDRRYADAKVSDEAATRAAADSAISSRVSSTEARAGNLEARTNVVETSAANSATKLASARLEFSAVTSGGRAALILRSDNNSGGAVDLIGDLRVSGDVVVDGTFKPMKFDKSSMSKEGQSSWSGNVTPGAGKSQSVPWSLGLGTVSPMGRFIWEYAASVVTNAGQREATTYNGKPLYTYYRDDGGLTVRCTDAQGNVYNPRPQGSSMVLASSAFDATFNAIISRGDYDTGIVSDGDYYTRTVSADYTVTDIRLKATWVAI